MNSRGLTCFSTKTSTSLVNPLLTSIFLFSWLLNGCGGGSLPAMPVVAPPPATTSNLSLSITSPMTKMSAPSPVHVSGSTQGGSVGTRYEVAVDGQVAVQGEGDAVEADLPLTIGKHSITVMASDSTGAKA